MKYQMGGKVPPQQAEEGSVSIAQVAQLLVAKGVANNYQEAYQMVVEHINEYAEEEATEIEQDQEVPEGGEEGMEEEEEMMPQGSQGAPQSGMQAMRKGGKVKAPQIKKLSKLKSPFESKKRY